MKKRNNDLIALQILDICLKGAGKTRILYQANLNSSKVNQYLINLVGNGLIEEVPAGSRVIYLTTSRGAELKRRFERLQCEIDELHSNLFPMEA